MTSGVHAHSRAQAFEEFDVAPSADTRIVDPQSRPCRKSGALTTDSPAELAAKATAIRRSQARFHTTRPRGETLSTNRVVLSARSPQ